MNLGQILWAIESFSREFNKWLLNEFWTEIFISAVFYNFNSNTRNWVQVFKQTISFSRRERCEKMLFLFASLEILYDCSWNSELVSLDVSTARKFQSQPMKQSMKSGATFGGGGRLRRVNPHSGIWQFRVYSSIGQIQFYFQKWHKTFF